MIIIVIIVGVIFFILFGIRLLMLSYRWQAGENIKTAQLLKDERLRFLEVLGSHKVVNQTPIPDSEIDKAMADIRSDLEGEISRLTDIIERSKVQIEKINNIL